MKNISKETVVQFFKDIDFIMLPRVHYYRKVLASELAAAQAGIDAGDLEYYNLFMDWAMETRRILEQIREEYVGIDQMLSGVYDIA